MNKYFDIKDKVYDVTEKYPETLDIFVETGFSQLANEAMRKIMGKTISVETACKSKKVNVDLFEQKLVDVIEQNRKSVDSALVSSKSDERGDVRIEGVLPCPIRVPLLEGFDSWAEGFTEKSGTKVGYELKSAHIGVDWIRDKLENAKEEDLADIYMSAGFDLFFDRKYMGHFVSDGIFEDNTGLERLNKDFDNDFLDLKDPLKRYTIIGVVPAVFMVNTDELNGRPFPKSWADILRPEFEKSVSVPTMDFDLFNALLLNIYKEFGEEGVRKLGKAQFKSMHPAEMVKSHMGNKPSGKPTVTIMPLFFTRMVRPDSPLKPQWPEDGAVISPVFLLTKKTTRDLTRPIVDYIFSKEVGDLMSTNGKFPSTNPEMDNKLEDNEKFMWLGWDYINSNDIGSLIHKAEDIFNGANQEDK